MYEEGSEEARLLVLHGYQMQANWLSWGLDKVMEKDLTWNTILYQYSQRLLKFVLNMQANTLPTPDNLRRWNINRDAVCGLCGDKQVTSSHVLAGCPWVRGAENGLEREDRYTWRHNNVLLLLAQTISAKLQSANACGVSKSSKQLIRFVPAGARVSASRPSRKLGALSLANDWVCDFDLKEFRQPGSRYVFPTMYARRP